MRTGRQWMNVRLRDGFLTDEFEAGIEEFVDFAQRFPELMDGTKIRCLCNDRKCQNRCFQELDTVRFCDAPNPGGPLTTRQPAEYKWRSGYPTPL